MPDLVSLFSSAGNLVIVVLGFGFLIFIHELGHFLAARWAGIRVLTFAIGIGPTAVSYRPGLGFRRTSSEHEYHALQVNDPQRARSVSPTEYSLKWLPLGGFVRMLGQEDLHPERVDESSDSYQNCAVWKRLIVISAGVIANIILAAILFVVVFMAGLKTVPPVIGAVRSDSPAMNAVADNPAADAAVERDGPGLKPRDRVLTIDDSRVLEFTDIDTAFAMAGPRQAVEVEVERAGFDRPLRFLVTPERDPLTKFLSAGVVPDFSTTLLAVPLSEWASWDARFAAFSASGIEPGATLTRLGFGSREPESVESYSDVVSVLQGSEGERATLVYANPGGSPVTIVAPTLLTGSVLDLDPRPNEQRNIAHFLGLVPVLSAEVVSNPAAIDAGLRPGDVFAKVGPHEYPSFGTAREYLAEHRNETIDVLIRRETDAGFELVPLALAVSQNATIGFIPGEALAAPLFASPVGPGYTMSGEREPAPPAKRVFDQPGLLVTSVGGVETPTIPDFQRELWLQTRDAFDEGRDARVPLTLRLPVPGQPGEEPATVVRVWPLTADEVADLHGQRWSLPITFTQFMPEEVVLQAEGPVAALGMGLQRTRSVMAQVYMTLARLFQGTVRVSHLSGPVGIAHAGTTLADRGVVWLLFFFALISVNLAVVNFLPIPVLDGGQFLFLCYEGLRKRPPPIAVQNALTLAGLVLIGSMFLVVTFNDLKRLIGF